MAGQPQQERPTQADVFSWLEQRRIALGTMPAAMREADAWLHAHERPAPAQVLRAVRRGFPGSWTANDFDIPPYSYIECNRAINSITTAQVPQATYEDAPWYKDRHQKTADEDEKAVQLADQSILRRITTRPGENPILDALWQQLALGLGCLYYPLDYDALGEPPDHGRGTPEEEEAWEAYERKRASALPWAVSSLHPTWLFPSLDTDPPEDVIIERPISLAAAARRFPGKGFDATAGSAQQTAKYREYISSEWYGCWVNDVPVTPGAADADGLAVNTRGFVWAQLIWSGLGKLDETGAWERLGVGLVQRGINNYLSRTWN